MTNHEIEKLAIDSFNNYNNGKFDDEFFDKKEAYHYGYNDGYLKGVEAEKLNYKNSIEHEMAVERTEYLKVITALVDDSSKLEKQLAIAKEALNKNVKTIGNFMDRLSVEGIGNPDISTARLGTIEALHCFKRSRSALEQIERGDK